MRISPKLFGLAVLLFLPASAAPASADTPEIHHEATVLFDPASRELRGADRLTVTRKGALKFRLAPWLTVTRAEISGATVRLKRERDFWQTVDTIAAPTSLTVSFSGIVPARTEQRDRRRHFGAFSEPSGTYLPASTAWLPEIGTGGGSYNLIVDVSGGQRAIATARLVHEEQKEAHYTAHFQSYALAEMPSLFVGPYQVRELKVNGIRIRTYFHADIERFAPSYLTSAARYLDQFSGRVGPYPYPDFHIVAAPIPVGLGFPNLTYIGRMIVPLPFMRGRSLAHEILHNWWGNGVLVDYAQGNWSEGLTTFLADYDLAAARDADAGREMRLGWLRDYAALPPDRDTPIANFVTKRHQASQVIGYNKVAHVFVMLQDLIGAESFSKGIRRFWREHLHKEAGWPDLKDAFEKAAGRSLESFFAQWVQRPGAPRIELAQLSRPDRDRIAITLRQSRPTYELSVPIVIASASGTERRVIVLRDVEQTFALSVGEEVQEVQIDPDFRVFRRLLSGESPPIMRDVTLSTRTAALILNDDKSFAEKGRRMVSRLMRDGQVAYVDHLTSDLPTILVGRPGDISDFLQAQGLDQIPERLAHAPGAAWVLSRGELPPLLIVLARDAQELGAMLRPLPHYGRQSYIAFSEGKVSTKGIWPSDSSPLRRRLTR
ncbi:MAG: M1 family aminopeptidase [Rhodospirillaceae bacterium]